MLLRWLFLGLSALMFGGNVFAIDLRITDAERMSLPPYCAKGHPNYSPHMCNGLNFINRYKRQINKGPNSFYLRQAVGELSYVIGHFGNKNTPAVVEAYFNRGLAYSYMEKWSKAADDWIMVVKLNPGYVMVYDYLANFYAKYKMNKQALEVVTTGLMNNPDSKLLQSKYDELGGTKPYPAPIAPSNPESQQGATPSAAGKTEAKQAEAPNAGSRASSDNSSIVTHQQSLPSTPIGSPSNPWCRFCPDAQPIQADPAPSTP